jgi:hypothetical protein
MTGSMAFPFPPDPTKLLTATQAFPPRKCLSAHRTQ